MVLGEDKLAGNVAVAEAEGDQPRHFGLAPAQHGVAGEEVVDPRQPRRHAELLGPRPDSTQRRACVRGSPEPGHDLGEADSRLNLIRCRTVAHGGRHRLNEVPLRGIEVAERGRTDPETYLVTPESHQASLS